MTSLQDLVDLIQTHRETILQEWVQRTRVHETDEFRQTRTFAAARVDFFVRLQSIWARPDDPAPRTALDRWIRARCTAGENSDTLIRRCVTLRDAICQVLGTAVERAPQATLLLDGVHHLFDEVERMIYRVCQDLAMARTVEQLRLAHEVSNEILMASDLEQLLPDVVRLIASKLSYMVVSLSRIEDDGAVSWAWTGEYGKTVQVGRDREKDGPFRLNAGEGIVGWALEQGTTVIVPDVLQEPRYIPHPYIRGVRSEIAVPLRQGGRAIGILDVESRAVGAFDEHDRQILELLASQISIALEKSRLFNIERKKSEYLALVNDVGRRAVGVLTVPELCEQATRLIHERFAYSSVGLFLVDPIRPILLLQCAAGAYENLTPPGYEQPIDQGILGHVAQTGQPFLTNAVQHDPYYYQPFQEMGATQAELCVPLWTGGRVIGVIDVQHTDTDRTFDEVDLLAMTALAGQVAIALDNARLFQDLERSVDQQTRLQEQLIHNEKISTIGQLVAGVAHELNNPLTSIIGYADLSLQRSQDDQTRSYLNRISKESHRMVQIVKSLLAFARKEQPQRTLVDLNTLIRDVLRLRAYNFRVSNIRLIERYEPDLPLTLGNANQLQQVILNIITNAEYAIRKVYSRGWIEITTGCDTIQDDQVIRVRIRDSGTGIPEEHLPKIFDPFFTTKQAGEGTGLGLSISSGIVREHGGRLLAESPPDEGACFTIELPVCTAETSTGRDARPATAIARLPLKRILVIDDEREITDYLAQVLTANGHTVETAFDGEAGLRKLDQVSYDLILSDIKMPGLSGRHLYNAVKTRQPHLLSRLILMTGDLTSPDTQQFLKTARVPYLTKPFTVHELEQVMAAVSEGQ
ncbi:MAG: GAF domain-containing protein [Candidatus Latescibacteria bacterium]|nr:GAF domain-containing protein [Candidatus Latescibacterota bacterium]